MKTKQITEAMVRTLKRFGNLFIMDINSINLVQLEKLVGFEVKYRQCSDNIGYVLERK